MNKLPKGYYAITSDFENADNVFFFGGVSYEVEKNVNLFPNVRAALDSISSDTPETCIPGLEAYGVLPCAVFLLTKGRHRIGRNRDTWVSVNRSLAIFGQKIGINPNLPAADPMVAPEMNPDRAELESESVLAGGYDYGAVGFGDPSVSLFILDGVTCSDDIRFRDLRGSNISGDCKFIFRNIIHKSPMGFHAYSMTAVSAELPYTREAVIENVRFDKDFFDLGYGGICFNLSNPRSTLKNICIDGTSQIFGFTTITRAPASFIENSEISIKDCYFANFGGENGIATSVRSGSLTLTIEDTTFINSSRENESPFNIDLSSEASEFIMKNCKVVDTRGNSAPLIEIKGAGRKISLENVEYIGYAAELGEAPVAPTEAPDFIENHKENWVTDTEDAHTVIGTDAADFSELDAYYEGCNVYYGDQHTHSNCGGTSDGKTPLGEWVEGMDKHGLDFAVLVDHRQMRGYFLPEWDEERMVMGTEPGCALLDPQGEKCIRATFHYNMVFPHKYALAMVLANFPEYEFHGDELTGRFGYPKFTKARLLELNDYLRSIGGMLVHAHPRNLMGSDEPLDYYFGEHSYLEVIVNGCASHNSFKSYDTWCEILARGKHMYAAAGSDTHGAVSPYCPSTFYTKRRFHTDFVERLYAGDYAPGGVGIKMFIDGHPMGSELAYKEGMKLTLRVGDFYRNTLKENNAYELQIITDQGIAYSSMFNGKEPQAVSLEVKDRKFYRVIVKNLTMGARVSVSNPIWLDKIEEATEK